MDEKGKFFRVIFGPFWLSFENFSPDYFVEWIICDFYIKEYYVIYQVKGWIYGSTGIWIECYRVSGRWLVGLWWGFQWKMSRFFQEFNSRIEETKNEVILENLYKFPLKKEKKIFSKENSNYVNFHALLPEPDLWIGGLLGTY